MFKSKNIRQSQEDLTTMDSDDHIYADAKFLTKRVNLQRLLGKREAASVQKNSEQISLHPNPGSTLNHLTSTRTANPINGHRLLATHQKNNLEVSMPNISGTINSTNKHNGRRTDEQDRRSGSHSNDDLPYNNHNQSKNDLCWTCCCFFLLYVLIIVIWMGFFILHYYYPHLFNSQHSMENEIVIHNIKYDFAILRRLAKAYCRDYIGMENKTFPKLAKMCAKAISIRKTVSGSLYNEDDDDDD